MQDTSQAALPSQCSGTTCGQVAIILDSIMIWPKLNHPSKMKTTLNIYALLLTEESKIRFPGSLVVY